MKQIQNPSFRTSTLPDGRIEVRWSQHVPSTTFDSEDSDISSAFRLSPASLTWLRAHRHDPSVRFPAADHVVIFDGSVLRELLAAVLPEEVPA